MSFKALGEQLVSLTNGVFGDSISYTPSGGLPVSINGIFDNAFVDVEGIVSLKPVLRIDLSDLVGAPGKGDQVTIDTVVYSVSESRLDGHGGTTLILKRA